MPVEGEDLAVLWDALARSIAAAGPDPERQRLYLAKLVLLLARENGRPERVGELAVLALRDLDRARDDAPHRAGIMQPPGGPGA